MDMLWYVVMVAQWEHSDVEKLIVVVGRSGKIEMSAGIEGQRNHVKHCYKGRWSTWMLIKYMWWSWET